MVRVNARSRTHVRRIGEAEFDDLVARSSVPVFVEFAADWCGPCRMMEPVLDAFARECRERAVVATVDADADPDLLERLRIRNVPTLAIYYQGRELSRQMGFVPHTYLEALLDAVLAAPAGAPTFVPFTIPAPPLTHASRAVAAV